MKIKYRAFIQLEFEEEVEYEDLIPNPKRTMDNNIKEVLEDALPENATIEVTSDYFEYI